ncbi:MAG: hypothetical protein JNG88_13010, partial [Phycisphaerales bacterium]|nr:hypothetical protein [Phycisphaerales bacterium]
MSNVSHNSRSIRHIVALACIALSVLTRAQIAGAQSAPGFTCTTQPGETRCWGRNIPPGWQNELILPYDIQDDDCPLNFLLWHGPAQPDYPPLTLNPAGSTMPLVPAGARAAVRGPERFATRPTLNGVVDLLSGAPVYREVDFELPFGGAVFRHIRTYSDSMNHRDIDRVQSQPQFWLRPEGAMWDWNGLNWVMSENPILLIDAAYRDITSPNYPQPGEPCEIPDPPPGTQYTVCYFIPDAHHAVPFIKQSNGEYVAPRWFDARLSHNSATPPTEYYVELAGGEIKYTFQAYRQDVPPSQRYVPTEECAGGDCDDNYGFGPCYCCNASHGTPEWRCVNSPGTTDYTYQVDGPDGIPYYGLLTHIQDRNGNRAELEYSTPRQIPVDAAGGTQYACNEKAQLRRVKLYAAGSAQAAWTIIYTYRPFLDSQVAEGIPPGFVGFPEFLGQHRQHVLHAIHVYPRDANDEPEHDTLPASIFYPDPDPNPQPPQTIDQSPFDTVVPPITDFEAYDAIDVEGICGLPADWSIRCKYIYEETDVLWYYYVSLQAPDLPYGRLYDSNYHDGGQPNLLLSHVTRRSDAAEPTDVFSMYRYKNMSASGSPDAYLSNAALRAVFGDDAIKRLLATSGTLVSCANPTGLMESFDDVYDLMTIDDDRCVLITEPDSPEPIARPIIMFADLEFRDELFSEHNSIGQAVGLNIEQDRVLPAMRTRLIDRRDGIKEYRLFLYRRTVETYPGSTSYYGNYDHIEARHWPFWCRPGDAAFEFTYTGNFSDQNWTSIYFQRPDWSTTFHTMVVDEVVPSTSLTILSSLRTSRRVLETNPPGLPVRDRTFTCNDIGNCDAITSNYGYGRQWFYQEYQSGKFRLHKVTSEGWGVGGEQGSPGLVQEYRYASQEDDAPITAVLISNGLDGDAFFLKSYQYDQNRPDLILEEYNYRELIAAASPPCTDPDNAGVEATVYSYEFQNNDPQGAITARTVSQSAAPIGADTSAPSAHPITRTKYDEQGREVWTAFGLSSTRAAAESDWLARFLATKSYDEPGEPDYLLQADVYDAASSPDQSATRLINIDHWETALAAPLELTTSYDYDDDLMLWHVAHPNDRHTYVVKTVDYQGSIEEITRTTFKDVVESSGQMTPLSPVEVVRSQGGRVLDSTQHAGVAFTGEPNNSTPLGEELRVTTPQYDANGQLIGVQVVGEDTASSTMRLEYAAAGGISRQQAPDGTLTRNEYDNFGRLWKVYRGTDDNHAYWNGQEYNCNATYSDNLVLVEKHEYGPEGANPHTNANRVVRIRHYRTMPDNQYDYPPQTCSPELPVNNEDEIGWIEEFEYDWRMRLVLTRKIVNASTVATTFTWYDNLDRACLVAEYGATTPSLSAALDPRFRGAGVAQPSLAEIADLLNAAPRPTRLSETIYNRRGLIEQTRDYDVTWSPSSEYPTPIYSGAQSYYDHAGRVIESRRPNAPTQRTVYDAKGRTVVSESVAANVVVSRTETRYSQNEQVTKTVHYERLAGSTSGDITSAGNGVASYSLSWSDHSGKVVASAAYGTNHASDILATGPDPAPAAAPGDLDDIPIPSRTPGGPLVTEYTYDDAGRQVAVTHPDGTVTRTRYDGLGRVLVTIENADDADVAQRRVTAHQYDSAGRLEKIAAVLPAQNVNPLDPQVNWSSTDGSVQVTQLLYGATVVDSGGAARSQNNSLIAEVRYPDPVTGQPSTTDALQFRYYFDGSVAERIDARGVKLTYHYDELGRLIGTIVDDSAWYVPGSIGEPPEPNIPGRVAKITYEHDDAGRLSRVTAFGDVEETIVIADGAFAYDGWGNLLTDWQEHGRPVSTNDGSPRVDYAWQFSPLDEHNYNRVVSLQYPPRVGDWETRHTLAFNYGSGPTSIDSALGRITSISLSGGPTLASYQFGGQARRVAITLGNGVAQTFVTATDAYGNLDRFGRTKDLHFKTAASATVRRDVYTYDTAGNRTSDRVTQFPSSTQDNKRSYWYGYDALSRLITADFGTLNTAATTILHTSPNPIAQRTAWDLDNLGNWAGGTAGGTGTPPGSVVRSKDSNRDGDFVDSGELQRALHHDTNSRNAIDAIMDWNAAASPPPTQPTTT